LAEGTPIGKWLLLKGRGQTNDSENSSKKWNFADDELEREGRRIARGFG
jgi:hypothetical protein